MNKKLLSEGLDYHDLEGQLLSVVSIDEYAAHMGEDSEIVTLAFTVRSEAAGSDLADWFERGYDWVLDAEVSEGEVAPGKYIVFVEIVRRSNSPERIIELLTDLNTLANIPLSDWTVSIDKEDFNADVEELRQVITISPHEYREDKNEEDTADEEELNEMREAAGLPVKRLYQSDDAALKAFKALAGL